jgi:hypothetical protein
MDGTVRENFLILKKSFDWLAAIRKNEEYQWRWNVNLARGPSNKFSSDSAQAPAGAFILILVPC